jgi:RNA polymerase sigma factor (sigma-70 family)
MLVIEKHKKLIYFIINRFKKKFPNCTMEGDDLFQLSCIAAIRAEKRYDPIKGEFPSYLYWIIVTQLLNAYKSDNNIIRSPIKSKPYKMVSLDDKMVEFMEEKLLLAEYKEVSADTLLMLEMVEQLEEKTLFIQKYYYGMPFRELSIIYGVSIQRVQEILKEATLKVRYKLA